MGTKIVMDRETVERMVLIGMDVDRYEARVIPDLQARVGVLTQALTDLLGSVAAARRDVLLAGQVEAASAHARAVLEAGISELTSGGTPA